MDEKRTWDLSSIVADRTITGITREMDSIESALRELREELRGDPTRISARDLAEVIRRLEALYERAETVEVYSHCGSAPSQRASESSA